MTTVRGPFSRRLRTIDEPSVQPTGTPPATVQGGYGTVPGAARTVDTTRPIPAPRQLSPKDAENLMRAELLQAVQSLTNVSTDLAARLGGQHGAVNGVLLVRVVVLDADGQWTYEGPVAIGSALIENHDVSTSMTAVAGGAAGGTKPSVGVGMREIPAGQERRMPVGSHVLQLWGPAGARASLQLFTGLQAYGVVGL